MAFVLLLLLLLLPLLFLWFLSSTGPWLGLLTLSNVSENRTTFVFRPHHWPPPRRRFAHGG